MRFLLIYFLIILSLPARAALFTDYELLKDIISPNPFVHYSVKHIPKAVKKAYKRKYRFALELAEPGAEYNTTDVVYEGEPSGRLIFLGVTAHHSGFVLYEIRGVKTQCQMLYYRMKGRVVVEMNSLILERVPSDHRDLVKIINEKAYL